MDKINIRKYQPKNSILRNLIKYFWIIRTNNEVSINYKLFPSNNIDFILNLSSPISYICDNKKTSFEGFHFSGIRNSHCIIQQTGILDVVGISFFPTGAYPFLKIPLSEFSDRTIFLDDIFSGFDSKIESFRKSVSDFDRINKLEKILFQLLDLSLLPREEHNQMISKIYCQNSKINVEEYCNQIGINQKTFERSFKKHIGINPKSFSKLTRFQNALNQLIGGKYSNLTSLSYNFDYFDQTHFIKDFKSYMGTTPLKFIKEKSSVKEILEYN